MAAQFDRWRTRASQAERVYLQPQREARRPPLFDSNEDGPEPWRSCAIGLVALICAGGLVLLLL